ncbi:hypothetical protein ES708_32106 [subsurface metagenome]
MLYDTLEHSRHHHHPGGFLPLHRLEPLLLVKLPHQGDGPAAVNTGHQRLHPGHVIEGHDQDIGFRGRFHIRRVDIAQHVGAVGVVVLRYPLGKAGGAGGKDKHGDILVF